MRAKKNTLFLLNIVFICLALVLGEARVFAADALRCEDVFQASPAIQNRLQIIDQPATFELSEMLFQLASDKKLLYRGKHKFEAGTEFLASNEFDWLETPFDHKPADVLIAFGTNSAWEIAVNKNVKSLYLADWSPYPLLASAYIVSPLIQIAKTPKEFIVLLSGQIPTEALLSESLDDIFYHSRQYSMTVSPEKLVETKKFLKFLAEYPFSEFEMRFLTSYFLGLAGAHSGPKSLGPFSELRHASFARLLNFYEQRYSPAISEIQNNKETQTVSLEQASVFSSQENFQRLRQLFLKDEVHYGLTSIMDMNFYKSLKKKERSLGRNTFAISITNIFDCGDYNGLTQRDLQNFLLGVTKIFNAHSKNPLVIFRTTNAQQPHGFHRYDLTHPRQIRDLQPKVPLEQAN